MLVYRQTYPLGWSIQRQIRLAGWVQEAEESINTNLPFWSNRLRGCQGSVPGVDGFHTCAHLPYLLWVSGQGTRECSMGSGRE